MVERGKLKSLESLENIPNFPNFFRGLKRPTASCMSGSGISNHPLRDEPGLKTKKNNHHSSEYSSPATHVRQGSWGNVCVTRCMCEYSREHSCVYVIGIIQYWERVLISVLLSSDPKISS